MPIYFPAEKVAGSNYPFQLESRWAPKNIRLNIEYDGANFHGWQRQLALPTIQGHIEDVLKKVLGRKTTLYGASRTDSGVHAKGQVANFFAESTIPPDRWAAVLNTQLPPTIRLSGSAEAPSDFHAQKDARAKIYEYRLLNRKSASALDRRVCFYPRPLSWEKIRESLPLFVGRKDFKAFQAAKADVRSTVRTVFRFELLEDEAGMFRFVVEGNGFLKQMVRTMIGTLLEIGENKRSPEEVHALFSERKRELAGRTAPAAGLCLVKVRYE